MKPSLPLAALAALLLVSLSFASAAERTEEATICAAGAKQAAAESSGESSCGAFFEPGAPLSSAEVAAIAASALPAQARTEADSSPFNATVPCPTTVIIGSGIDAARVEAQVRESGWREKLRRWASETEKKAACGKPAFCLLSLPLPRFFSLVVLGLKSGTSRGLKMLDSFP
jgi:hypothetical protein